ncbi:MAG: tocopherol cyclase family protein [Fidelibacterota bacterium]
MFRCLQPSVFQGSLKRRSYFEGWYIKCLSDDLSSSVAFIPGISLSEDRHAFIQVNTSGGRTEYIRFPLGDFTFNPRLFDISIAKNRFSAEGVYLDIERPGISLHGSLSFSNMHKFPSAFLSPGIMGWFSFVPFMECYHGVVSMRHRIEGNLRYNGQEYLFGEGTGYIEKDWGRSFPRSWVWMQANPFRNSDASFMLSIARIPWMGHWFPGLIGYLYHEGKLNRFATYLGDKTHELKIRGNELQIMLGKRRQRLTVTANQNGNGQLIAPVKGKMNRTMKESMNATLHVKLENDKGDLIFNDISYIGGLEIAGNVKSLRNIKKSM